MVMDKTKEWWNPALIGGVAGLLDVLNEGVDGWAIGLAEVNECGIAARGEGMTLKVKAWAEGAS